MVEIYLSGSDEDGGGEDGVMTGDKEDIGQMDWAEEMVVH